MAEELHGPVERPRVRQRVSPSHIPDVVPPMPTLIPHDLSIWMQDRQSDLQQAMIVGGHQENVGVDFTPESRRRETCRVDRRYGVLRRMPVCKRITRWGLRGVRIGEASNPGPKKSFSKGVHWSRKRQQRTLLDSDSDAPLITRGRFGFLSSDDEDTSVVGVSRVPTAIDSSVSAARSS